MPSRRQFLTIGGAGLAAGLAGCNTILQGSTETDHSPTPTPTEPADTDGATAPPSNVYSQVYEGAIDAVVRISAGEASGTGFLYDGSHVVTNAHVVGEATDADVRYSSGNWSTGQVVGTDAHSDLAVIAVESTPEGASDLPFIEYEPTIGQEVVAIGNPFNLSGSVTTGVVSGINRTIPAPTGYQIPDAVQTSAAVNPGNSGGPLMSLDGRVVAVINSGGGENIGFGISAALTSRVVPRLIETGDFEHSFMGVSFTDVSPAIAEANDLEEPQGLLIAEVLDGGPADGVLQPSSDAAVVDGQQVRVGGDILLAVEGRQLVTSEDLMSYLALETRPGETLELTILRNGNRQSVSFELESRPGSVRS